jgi:hypothetical protein
MSVLWVVASVVVVLNLPFGFWRATTRRFTLPWVLAVHAPVPLVVGLRFAAGLGWKLVTFPVLVGAFCTGQYVGGRLHTWWHQRVPRP